MDSTSAALTALILLLIFIFLRWLWSHKLSVIERERQEWTQAGRAVLGAGDVNCDCVDDVVIGAPVPLGGGTVTTEVDAAHLIFGHGF